MSTNKKLVIAVVALATALCCMVGGTLAWLISTPTAVTNTFTVGELEIVLNEAPVDATGKETTGDRVLANTYNLVPNGSYDKDPMVTVTAGNEKCYVFVKVENGISAIEDQTNTIAAQIKANNWTELTEGSGIYYKVVEASDDDTELVVFETFKISSTVTKDTIANYKDAEINVTAYAIQYLGFEGKPAEAWAVFNP